MVDCAKPVDLKNSKTHRTSTVKLSILFISEKGKPSKIIKKADQEAALLRAVLQMNLFLTD
jgi:hypothetical protein